MPGTTNFGEIITAEGFVSGVAASISSNVRSDRAPLDGRGGRAPDQERLSDPWVKMNR